MDPTPRSFPAIGLPFRCSGGEDRIGDLLDPNSDVTLVKTNADGLQEIIVKRGTEITAYELTGETLGGEGERLGTAYRLANGQIIYVPD